MLIQNRLVVFSRIALFVIYFWFGLLKVIEMSPASEMVEKLLGMTMSFIPFSLFIILFGLFEMLIGFVFLVKGLEKFAFALFAIHIFTTIIPLFFMGEVWTSVMVPTLEGQYIIKNIALVVCALIVFDSSRRTSNF